MFYFPTRSNLLLVSTALSIVILLLYFLSRLYNLSIFPAFLDEGIHLQFVQDMLRGDLFANAADGRLFAIWYYALFRPDTAGNVWLIRAVTVLAILPGAAALIAVGRHYARSIGALLVGLAILFSPYHWFFDRLALADCVAGSLVLISLLIGSKQRFRTRWYEAVSIGLLLFLAIGVKLSTLPFLIIPIIAALNGLQDSKPTVPIRARLIWFTLALGTALLLLAALTIVLRANGHNLFALLGVHNRLSDTPLPIRLATNIRISIEMGIAYLGVPMLIMLGIACGILLIRRQFYVLACLFVPLAAIWLNTSQYSRFFYVPMALAAVIPALTIAILVRKQSRLIRLIAVLVLIVYGTFHWMPFVATGLSQPDRLPLSFADRQEYIYGDASGFGIAETAQALKDTNASEVIGLLSNCYHLQVLLAGTIPVQCPKLNPNGAEIPNLIRLIEDNRREGVFVVLERLPFVPDSAPGRVIQVIERPQGGIARPLLQIIDLSANPRP